MKNRKAELITALAVAVCLAVCCLAADRFRPETPELSARPAMIREAEVIDFRILETPAPTPTPNILPRNAADIYINDETVLCTLVNEKAAQSVLKNYLKAMSEVIPEGEHLISAEFAAPVRIIPTTGTLPLSTAAEALAMLKEDPSVLPVKVVTEHTEYAKSNHRRETSEEPALQKGVRFIRQVGKDGLSAMRSECTYEAGELIAKTEPVLELIWESRPYIVKNGTLWSDKPDGTAGKKEGPRGREFPGPALQLPFRVSISKYFGVSEGKFHRGIDLFGRAGTEIKTPGEGVVRYLGVRGDYGLVIEIDHGDGFVSRLTHCAEPQVLLNQRVFRNETVAVLAPNEEQPSVKPHLHYELLIDGIPYNPLYYIG